MTAVRPAWAVVFAGVALLTLAIGAQLLLNGRQRVLQQPVHRIEGVDLLQRREVLYTAQPLAGSIDRALRSVSLRERGWGRDRLHAPTLPCATCVDAVPIAFSFAGADARSGGISVASVEQCAQALKVLVDKLAGVDPATRKKHTLERTLSCTISDLDVSFRGRLGHDGVEDMEQCAVGVVPLAQIKLAVGSDDLLALVEGTLGFASAWASGRLKIDASMMDVLRLRAFI